ncbi:hypothetical protein BST61_g4440 [Cercospora zeina]
MRAAPPVLAVLALLGCQGGAIVRLEPAWTAYSTWARRSTSAAGAGAASAAAETRQHDETRAKRCSSALGPTTQGSSLGALRDDVNATVPEEMQIVGVDHHAGGTWTLLQIEMQPAPRAF